MDVCFGDDDREVGVEENEVLNVVTEFKQIKFEVYYVVHNNIRDSVLLEGD